MDDLDPRNPRQRYRNDPVFSRLVDTLRGLIRHGETTPSELREALLLAAVLEEMANPIPGSLRVTALAEELLEEAAIIRRRIGG